MTEPTVLRWETLTKKQFDTIDRKNAVVLVTCSPLEVHGPHLPLGADALEGEGLAMRMLRYLPDRHRSRTFLKLPFIYTATDTLPHPGSLFFKPSTTIAVLEDLGRSLAGQGFENIFVSNFHGSPRHFLALETACDRISLERSIKMVCIFSVMLTRLTGGTSELYEALGGLPGLNKEDLKGDTHAGIVETSQLLALHPEWVERDYSELPRVTVDTWLAERGLPPAEVEPGSPGAIFKMIGAFQNALRFFRAETYSGAPGSASPELGERILATLGERTAEAVSDILDGTLPRRQWHSPLWPMRFIFVNPVMVNFFNRFLGVSEEMA